MAKSVLISNVLPAEARTMIPPEIKVDYHDTDQPLPKAELIKRLQGKDGLICHLISTIDDEVLGSAPNLKVAANVAVGYNNIDVAAATRRGVVVTNTPDVLTETTADFAFTLLMAAARRVVEADRYARSGQWKAWKWDLLWGADVHGTTLGIVGFGRIGRAVARRALGFNMRVLYHDAVRADAAVERELSATATDLETLLREADFVTLHTNLTPETRHLIGERTLRLMRKSAIVVNAARGATPAVSATSSACATIARAAGRSRRRCSWNFAISSQGSRSNASWSLAASQSAHAASQRAARFSQRARRRRTRWAAGPARSAVSAAR